MSLNFLSGKVLTTHIEGEGVSMKARDRSYSIQRFSGNGELPSPCINRLGIRKPQGKLLLSLFE